MSAPIRTLSGTCEISTGTLSINGMPPVYQGDNSVEVSISLTNAGKPYNVPNDVNASMHLYYMHNQAMTESQPMQKIGSIISGIIPDALTALGGTPLLVIRLIDTNGRIITTCSVRITIVRTLGSAVVSTIPPTPDEIVYVGRAPYIGENGHWFQWDNDQAIYVDSQVEAQGPVGPAGGVDSVNGKTGDVSLNATDVGAMPTGGGTFTGNIAVSKTDPYVSLENTGTNNKFGFHVYGDEAGKGVLALYDQTKAEHVFGVYSYLKKVTFEWPVDLLSALGVASGGTGANNAAGARANLGITPQNIGALSKSGDTAAGNIIVGTDANDAFIGFIAKRVSSDDGAVYKTQMACGAAGSGKVSFMTNANTILNEMELGKTQTTFTKPVALSSGGLGRSFASEAELKNYLKTLLGLS